MPEFDGKIVCDGYQAEHLLEFSTLSICKAVMIFLLNRIFDVVALP